MDYKIFQEKLNNEGIFAFTPRGNSMYPFIDGKKNSVIIEKKKERLKKYDVALYYRKDGQAVLHRVIEVVSDGYIMMGDSQFTEEKIKEDCVIGKMTKFVYKEKFINSDDEKYLKKVDYYCNHKLYKKIRIKFFYLKIKIKKLFSIFGKKQDKNV